MIFQSFFSTKGKKGTGIGLMLTKKIVGEHGGVMDIETRTPVHSCMLPLDMLLLSQKDFC